MDLYDLVSDLCKRRGFLFPSFEAYGGVSGFYDYGPLGSALKRNIEEKWRDLFVRREGMAEIEASVIMPSPVFEASGHVKHFTDLMVKCRSCGKAYRTDALLDENGVKYKEGCSATALDLLVAENEVRCPECRGELGSSEAFNLMFDVEIGPYGNSIRGYGRPEAAQGQFVDFKRVYSAMRERLPLGIAQVGRCMRNEIAPRKGPIRLREFTIIDYEIFLDPESPGYPGINRVENTTLGLLTAAEQMNGSNTVEQVTVKEALTRKMILSEVTAFFMALASLFIEELGIPRERQRFREALPEEKAHYSLQTFDQEVCLDRWGWTEISGHAYRTDFDLSRHMAYSGADLRVYKAFDKPTLMKKPVIKPEVKRIEDDFPNESKSILEWVSRSDPQSVNGSLQRSGFYELPGERGIRLDNRYLKVEYLEEEEQGRWFIPYVAEPSFGVDRIFYAVLEHAYQKRNDRIILKLPKDVAPIQAAIFPLVAKDGLPEAAQKIHLALVDEGFWVDYDHSGSIGRRYARADEVGVPVCITIDYQTLEDNTVTLREMESWKQVRAKSEELPTLLEAYLDEKRMFSDLGQPVDARVRK